MCFKNVNRQTCRNKPLGSARCRREDNIKMDLKENGANTRNWVVSPHDRDYWRALVKAALNLRLT